MVQQQGIVKGDVLQRIASIGLILGAILMVIPSLLHPRISDPSNTQEVLQQLGSKELLVQIYCVLVAVGFWAVMVGVAGVYRSITTGAGAAWARLGFYGILVGTAVFTVAAALGLARAGAAANWVAAPAAGKATAYNI